MSDILDTTGTAPAGEEGAAEGRRPDAAYQVLARKYRPGHFRDLIGQEAMVKTLTNAFAHDRIAHAFVLTGVRGVGKTTTARIIAKGLNCTGREGGRPTIDPCGACPACVSIAAGRHVDVIEMDAASNTGVDYIREITDAARYRPTEARYKVWIIDEVHMLSPGAFNALLKTLEEPPPHVKFILATTEIRKVPVTVLSRCQRFDLRRIEPEVMMEHLAGIAAREGAKVTPDALALVTRAAEGSVRDALSLLDQAIAHGDAAGGAETDADAVRRMLGLADRARVLDLFEAVMKGDTAAALAELGEQYADGADPAVVLRDLAELTHWISVLKVSDAIADDPTVTPTERTRGRDFAARLSMRVLTRAWQMLLKAMEELPLAPSAIMAAEMALIRLTHVAELPTPEELVRRLSPEGGPPPAPGPSAGGGATGGGGGGARGPTAPGPSGGPAGPRAMLRPVEGGGAPAETAAAALADAAPVGTLLGSLEDVAALIASDRNIKLADEVERFLRPVSIRPGVIEVSLVPAAPATLAGQVAQTLTRLAGARWSVVVSGAEGGATIAERRRAERESMTAAAEAHPLVLAALEAFPGAKLGTVRPLGSASAEDEAAPVFTDATVEIDGDILDADDPFGEEI